MNAIEMQYKADTGNCHYKHIETRMVIDALDVRFFDGWKQGDILNAIESETPKWGILIEELPKEYDDATDVFIPTPEYIQWLEEKITELQK